MNELGSAEHCPPVSVFCALGATLPHYTYGGHASIKTKSRAKKRKDRHRQIDRATERRELMSLLYVMYDVGHVRSFVRETAPEDKGQQACTYVAQKLVAGTYHRRLPGILT